MSSLLKRFGTALLCVGLSLTTSAIAQLLYGSLVGNVKDASDAAVAGAVVLITNLQTNQTRQVLTNEVGASSLATIEPGSYRIRVSKEGFNTFNETNVTVSINSVSRVDVTLTVGAVTETVEVSAQTALLQT